MNKKLKEIEKQLIKTKFVSIETQINKHTQITQSRYGGIPYWPEDRLYPHLDKKPAKMLAQINFAEVSNVLALPDFPKEGILQFFCPYQDDMWGLTFDEEPCFGTVVYHADIHKPHSISPQVEKISNDMDNLPGENILSLRFKWREEFLGFSDEFQCQKYYDFNIYDLGDDVADELFEKCSNSGSKVGGFAYFTQQDPRPSFFPKDEDWILLFQLDTDDNIMWGDCGVANWFIKREDLKNLDFSRVLFNWDCC